MGVRYHLRFFQDFLLKLEIKPLIHLLEISIFPKRIEGRTENLLGPNSNIEFLKHFMNILLEN